MHGYGYGWLWPMWGMMALFWLVVIGLVVWLVVRYARPHSPGDDARRVLAERYARGELNTEEYHHRLESLERGSRPAR